MTVRTAAPSTSVIRVARWLAIVVSVLCLLALLALQVSAITDQIPSSILPALDTNTEALSFVVLLVSRLSIVADRGWRDRLWWIVVAVLMVVTGDSGRSMGVGIAVFTHGEPVIAAAGLGLYLRLPVEHRRGWIVPGALLLIAIVAELPGLGQQDGAITGWVIRQAEAIGMLLLGIVLVDVVQPRWRLDRPPLAVPLRVVWHAALAVCAVALVLLYPDGVSEAVEEAVGAIDHVGVWLIRNLESFLAVLGLSLVIELNAWLSGRTDAT